MCNHDLCNCPVCFDGRINILYLVAAVISVFLLIVLIGGAASPWYKWDQKTGTGSGETQDFLEYLTFVDLNPGDRCNYADSSCFLSSTIWNAIYFTILSVLILSILLCFVVAILLIVLSFSFFGGTLKLPPILLQGIRIPILVIIVFITLFTVFCWVVLTAAHPKMLRETLNLSCDETTDLSGPNGGVGPLCDFAGSEDGLKWGPNAGWVIILISTLIAIILFLVTVLGGLPAGIESDDDDDGGNDGDDGGQEMQEPPAQGGDDDFKY